MQSNNFNKENFDKLVKYISANKNTTVYIKNTPTLGRKPSFKEINTPLITYILRDGKIEKESEKRIDSEIIIARNPISLGFLNGVEIFNEWCVGVDTWRRNYGQLPKEDKFESMYKIVGIRALEVSEAIFNDLALYLEQDGNILYYPQEKMDKGISFGIGDFICVEGYPINKLEMEKTYIKSKN